jgi:eukaryotic-like serine/threonine-protein kinase
VNGIADYTFIRSLGAGNHGHFYLAARPARLPVDLAQVAVKVLHAESTEATFRRATRELAAFAAVRSPFLAGPLDAGQQDGTFYYAMPYLSGGSLAAPAEAVPVERALAVLADAARAVADLHAAGIVHRDVKPANVLLDGDRGKLADLGLAHVFDEGMVVTGMAPLDSVEYVDPAQLLGEPPTPAHDVWSLGVTAHRVLAGTGVHGQLPADDGLLALRRVVSTPPVVSDALAAPVADLVRDCLARAERRPDAASVAARLSTLLSTPLSTVDGER